ncbi:hypothetical protein ABES36_14885 [Bacillus pseudomycoides]|uniref:hypothetical protein n=1 Tax=Bacillus pseudomycoides TaxID=64104 RepID=UPI003D1AD1BF
MTKYDTPYLRTDVTFNTLGETRYATVSRGGGIVFNHPQMYIKDLYGNEVKSYHANDKTAVEVVSAMDKHLISIYGTLIIDVNGDGAYEKVTPGYVLEEPSLDASPLEYMTVQDYWSLIGLGDSIDAEEQKKIEAMRDKFRE